MHALNAISAAYSYQEHVTAATCCAQIPVDYSKSCAIAGLHVYDLVDRHQELK